MLEGAAAERDIFRELALDYREMDAVQRGVRDAKKSFPLVQSQVSPADDKNLSQNELEAAMDSSYFFLLHEECTS